MFIGYAKWKYACIILFALQMVSSYVFGQVTVNIPIQVNGGYTLQELSQTSYLNTSGQKFNACNATITANNTTDGESFTFRTSPFNLPQGSSLPGYNVFIGSSLISPSPDYYELEQNGKFPPGIYNLCISVYDARGNLLGKACTSLNILNAGNLILISPTDEEILNTFNPTFNWLPLKSLGDNKYIYNIHIAELLPGQSYGDAISLNPPLVYEVNVTGSTFNYPSGAPQLEDSKQYVWQIEANLRNHNITYSEIWMFQYKKSKHTDTITHQKPPIVYPYVTKKLSSAYYEYSDTINFKYINYANDTTLNYSFKKSGKADTIKLSEKLHLKLKPLTNYIRIPVTDEMKNQKKNVVYRLEVRNSRNETWTLQFIINKAKKGN